MVMACYVRAQYVYTINADSVKITNHCDSAELIIQNHTQGVVGGFLYNTGNGRITSTPPNGTSTTQLADTKFVMNNINQMLDTCGFITASALVPYAPLNSPVLSGVPQVSTPPNGTSTNQIADTKFVMNNINQMLDTGGIIQRVDISDADIIL